MLSGEASLVGAPGRRRNGKNPDPFVACYQGHFADKFVSVQLADQSSSPGDPLFFLHHTNLDRLWWQWQSANLSSRLNEMGGRNVPLNSSLLIGKWLYPGPEVLEYDGDPANETTMNHNLWTAGLMPNITVLDTMDLRAEFSCADYVDDELSGSDAAW